MPVREGNGYLVGQQDIQRVLMTGGVSPQDFCGHIHWFSTYKLSWLLGETEGIAVSHSVSGFVLQQGIVALL